MPLRLRTTDVTDDAWTPDHLFTMVRAADTDVAAFLLLAKAATPDELRTLAAVVGVDDIDQLRELTVRVTVKVRDLGAAAELHLRSWVASRHDRMNGNRRFVQHDA